MPFNNAVRAVDHPPLIGRFNNLLKQQSDAAALESNDSRTPIFNGHLALVAFRFAFYVPNDLLCVRITEDITHHVELVRAVVQQPL